MPLVQITLIEGRPPARLEDLIRAVTDAVAETLDAPRDAIRVLITQIPPDQWGIGGRPASQVRAAAGRSQPVPED